MGATSDKQLEHFPNLVTMFLSARCERSATVRSCGRRSRGQWQSISYAEAARQVAALAESLKRLGLKPGDRVMLVSENRPEWLIADLGIMAAGCITVPTYTTNTTRDHQHILANSGGERGDRVDPEAGASRWSRRCCSPPNATTSSRSTTSAPASRRDVAHFHHWAGPGRRRPADIGALEQRMAEVERGDLACIIYTSGTGGAPRGVMQHHGMILHNVEGCIDIIANDFGWDDEVFLSFLPASHAYEHSGGQHFPVALGAQIYYAESLEKLAANIEEVRPTIMVVVPRLFEMLRARIMKTGRKGRRRCPHYLMSRALVDRDASAMPADQRRGTCRWTASCR